MQNTATRLCRKKAVIYLFAAFLLPALILLLAYALIGVHPFGDKSLLIMDMSDQYVEFYANLRQSLEQGNLFFSWTKQMGGSTVGLFAYYLSSPLSVLTLLFPKAMLLDALLFLNLLKVGLCGFTFCLFYRERFQKEGLGAVFFSLLYALMSYTVVYSMCLMWLDAVILLPVVLMGIERLLQGRRPLLLIGSLFLVFVANYYIAFMVGVFSFLYFLFRFFTKEGLPSLRFGRALGRFFLSALAAAGLGAVLLVPTFFSLMQGKIGSNTLPVAPFTWSFFPGFLEKCLPGAYDSITQEGLPNVFCGLAALYLAAVFFFLPGRLVAKQEKIGAGLLLAFLFLSLAVPGLDVAWHIFQVPNWFPHRYSFVFSFFLLYLACRTFQHLREVPLPALLSGLPFPALCAAVAFFRKSISAAAFGGILAAVLLLSCLFYFGAGRAAARGKKAGAVLGALLLLFGIAETGYNTRGVVKGLEKQFGYESYSQYAAFQSAVAPLVEKADALEEGRFFRMEKDFERSKNDAMGFGYNGVTHYSSAYHRGVNQMLRSLGFAQAFSWVTYYGSTALTDSLFGVKYVMAQKPVAADYLSVMQSQGITLYQTPSALSLALPARGEAIPTFTENPLRNQEALLKMMTGYEGEYWIEPLKIADDWDEQYPGGPARRNFVFTAAAEGPVYAYFPEINTPHRLFVGGEARGVCFGNAESRCNYYLGDYQKGDVFTVSLVPLGEEVEIADPIVYTLDHEAFERDVSALRQREMAIDSWDAHGLSGRVTLQEGEFLFTSIPYDEGWQVNVDGKGVQAQSFADAFLCIPMEAGTHTITLRYSPKGAAAGGWISAATAAILCIWLLAARRKGRRCGR